MITALILVNTALGQERKVFENVKKIEGVEEASFLYGVYDLMVKVKINSIDKLKEFIRLQLSHLKGVVGVLTLTVIESPINF